MIGDEFSAERDRVGQIPILFVHRGNSSHLARSLAMARATDPSREVVLLGDEANRSLANSLGVNHVLASNYSQGARRLNELYVHRSTHGRDFELVCLQRWFEVLDWMNAAEVERAVYLDSDVLLFAPLEMVLAAVTDYPMTMVIDAAHTSFINQRSALASFCRFVEVHYSSQEGLLQIERLHEVHLSISDKGGISDMTFLKLFMRDHPEILHSTPGPLTEKNWAIDLTINDGEGGFEMNGPFKRIEWRHGYPHGHRIANDDWIPFLTLHFQGVAKCMLPKFTSPLPFGIRLRVWRNDLQLIWARFGRLWSRLISRICPLKP